MVPLEIGILRGAFLQRVPAEGFARPAHALGHLFPHGDHNRRGGIALRQRITLARDRQGFAAGGFAGKGLAPFVAQFAQPDAAVRAEGLEGRVGFERLGDHIAGAGGDDLDGHKAGFALLGGVELLGQLAQQRRHLRRGGNHQAVRIKGRGRGGGGGLSHYLSCRPIRASSKIPRNNIRRNVRVFILAPPGGYFNTFNSYQRSRVVRTSRSGFFMLVER